jgi:tetratricopeptide (TPR) repeat protein
MCQQLTSALQMHQAGHLNAAAQVYRSILAREAENADALHLLGVLYHQQGDHARGIDAIGRAVALRPNVALFHANLAEAYRATGQLDRAAGCCRTALRLWPDNPEALCNLGLALQGLGRKDEAIESFLRAVSLNPDFAAAHNNLALLLRERSQLDEALSHFRQAVQADSTFAPAQTNLGQLLLDRGQPAEALPHCREAVRLQPDVAAMHHNLGNVLRALEQFVEARAAYLEAIRLAPDLAASHAHLGLILHREGQHDDALSWLRQAVELEPENASYWEHLGELRQDRDELPEAVSCFDRVLVLAPDRLGARLSLGWALQDQGHLAEAGQHYRAVLDSQPDWAGAHLNLGGLHEELGALADAEDCFRAALRLQPAYALPWARLGTLLRGKLPDADRAGLEARLADTDLADGPRARLLFALAHIRDARADYAGAADCLQQANALTLAANRVSRPYAPDEHERFVDRLIEVFDADFFTRTRGMGSQTQRPVFIFGLPRSGTTLTEQVLASHPRVHGAGELRLARQSFESIPDVVGGSGLPLDHAGSLDAQRLCRLADQHLDWLHALDGDQAVRVVDKMPDNYLYLGLLAAVFPNAVFIHCRRDLRDVAVSCWITDFRSIRWANDPEHIAGRFQQYRRIMDHWWTVLPVPVHEVTYEETVADLEGVARRLVAACGLEWQPACLEFHRTQRPIRTASVTQVRQPVYTKSVARWKHYERDLAGLFAALPGDLTEEIEPQRHREHREHRESNCRSN